MVKYNNIHHLCCLSCEQRRIGVFETIDLGPQEVDRTLRRVLPHKEMSTLNVDP